MKPKVGEPIRWLDHNGVEHAGTVARLSSHGKSVLVRHRTDTSEWLDFVPIERIIGRQQEQEGED